ncbi:HAMP domain-containing sensor histidine kinase [Niveibacterium sp. SC-1]|uniref:HAMP domain-containing sensor histidine kinase n=1 Tax=Niveibacterium sp. SC-1 TaxID=3135646 RepID=UPI00311D3657
MPILFVLGDTLFALRALSIQSRHSVLFGVGLTRELRALGEDLTSLERVARQQLILGDEDGNAYPRLREQLSRDLQRIAARNLGGAEQALLQKIHQGDSAIAELLVSGQPGEEISTPVLTHFEDMNSTLQILREDLDRRIESEIGALTARTAALRDRAIAWLGILLPLAVVLAWIVFWLVRRSMRQLERAIRRLGDGRLDTAVQVRGPRDLEALGEQLDWLRIRLSEVDAQKTRFLHHVSHELKTPLTAVYEGSQLLSEGVAGRLNAQQQEIAGILRDNVIRLRQLIENLLDYSSIRFQPLPLVRESVTIGEIFARVEHDQRLALAARKLALHKRDEGIKLLADAEKLRVVVDNLVSNAVKYAPENSAIELIARRDEDWAVIEVADFGPGVPETARLAVFEPFVQATAPKGASIKGTGLGLSIVKELVVAHGGDVSLHANHPVGTRVRLRLPIFGKAGTA